MKTYRNSKEKYPTCKIQFEITAENQDSINQKEFAEVANRIALSGGTMVRIGNIIDITFDQDAFIKARTRKCGQKEKAVTDINDESVTFADLVYWHYGLKETWTEIACRLNISRATFFRRKKKYEQYSYFNHYMSSYDRSKADDLEYLRSLQDGNSLFI